MFSSCIGRSLIVWTWGDGGVESVKGFSSLDGVNDVIDDSVVGEEVMDDSALLNEITAGLMVSARKREEKRLLTRGWSFQLEASVEDVGFLKVKYTLQTHCVVDM